ncbi:hypothetical protein GTQ34_15885 [Muricauda sp. JGD-17]|uniref:TolB protein n=1 Tax=Flagellimonas ochracea TaxID=2696472 RepID=A0A964TFZ6_9FLAO|nr:DPP IV N-terminal domain-containing protein [Allomuricauda ochracea]NAY93391.1 hypothetical protein [Allomuricauda ochracea]
MKLIVTFCSLFIISVINGQNDFKIITSVVDSYPMESPATGEILFSSNRTGIYQIYKSNNEGDNIIPLTNSQGGNYTPVWSPDGSRIVFASERDNDSEIYIMNADGGNQVRLTNILGDDSHPKFSPDGRRIIFNSPRSTPDLSIAWVLQYHEIYTMDLDGGNLKQHTSFKSIATYPSYSPDGNKILFRLAEKEKALNWSLKPSDYNSEVYLMNVDGSDLRNLSNSDAFDGWPFWHPSSKKIFFTSNRGGVPNKGQLYSINLKNSNLEKISENQNSFIQASFSRDGKYIFAQRNYETDEYEYGQIIKIEYQYIR